MKSVILTKYGAPEVLQVREFETPEPKANEVRIKVHYAGINFAEIMARMKLYPGGPKPGSVLGGEVSGIVDKVGAEIKDIEVGQNVIGLSMKGSYTSHVCLEPQSIIPIPQNFKLDEAATFPVIYITALTITAPIRRPPKIPNGPRIDPDCKSMPNRPRIDPEFP